MLGGLFALAGLYVGMACFFVLWFAGRLAGSFVARAPLEGAVIGLGPRLGAFRAFGVPITVHVLPFGASVSLARGTASQHLPIVVGPYLVVSAFFLVCNATIISITGKASSGEHAAKARVVTVLPATWPATTGLQKDDVIISVGGWPVSSVGSCHAALARLVGSSDVPLVVSRDGKVLSLPASLDFASYSSSTGYPFDLAFPVSTVLRQPFGELQQGDRIVSVGGRSVSHPAEILSLLVSSQGVVAVDVVRGAQPTRVSVPGGNRVAHLSRRFQAIDEIPARDFSWAQGFEAARLTWLGGQAGTLRMLLQWANPLVSGSRSNALRSLGFAAYQISGLPETPREALVLLSRLMLAMVLLNLLPVWSFDGHLYLRGQADMLGERTGVESVRTLLVRSVDALATAISLVFAIGLLRLAWEPFGR